MSDDGSDNVLQELALLSALESVNAKVDTSAIAEIKDWWGAVGGKFYKAKVEQSLPAHDHSSELIGPPDRPTVIRVPSVVSHATSEGTGLAQMKSAELVSSCISTNDEAAWVEFMRRYQPLIAGAIITRARRMGRFSTSLIDDLVQETFLKLLANNFRALRNFEWKHENAFLGFLKVIAMHVVQDHFRGYAAASPSNQDLAEINAPEKSAKTIEYSTDIEKNIQRQKIDEWLQADSQHPNSARDSKIFWLYYGEGMTAKEISELPDIRLNVKGVESALLRLTQQIRNRLSPASEKKTTKKRH